MRFVAVTLMFGLALVLAPQEGRAAGAKPAASAEVDTRVIEQSNVVTPVVRGGRLVNYLFVTVRVELNASGDVWKLKERSHFLRDSLVRATHRASLADSKDDRALDRAAAEKVFLLAAQEALGAQAVKAIQITDVDSLRR